MLLKRREELMHLYPPRAELAILPEKIKNLKNFIAQFKYNDIRLLLYFFPSQAPFIRSRKLQPILQYRLSTQMRESLSRLNLAKDQFHLLDGGLLRNAKVRGERIIVLWDILVFNGDYLLGSDYSTRYRLLNRVCGNPRRLEKTTGQRAGREITPLLWLAPIFRSNYSNHFKQALRSDCLEGLLFKNPHAPLERGWRERNNAAWQVKVRKPRADYMF